MTPNLWTLPETVHFADTDWRVHTDFRRWRCSTGIFRSCRQCNTEKPVKQWQHLCRQAAPTADPVRPG